MTMINLKNLEKLTNGDNTLLSHFLNEFISTTESDILSLQQEINENNSEKVNYLAHRIKGSSMIIGAEKLVELSGKLEDAGVQNNDHRYRTLFSELHSHYLEVAQFIRSL